MVCHWLPCDPGSGGKGVPGGGGQVGPGVSSMDSQGLDLNLIA